MKTFCFKLYNSQRNKHLNRLINTAGLIYNHCIALHKRYYRLYKTYLDLNKLQHHLAKIKYQEKFSYISILNAQSVQEIAERIDKAYRAFWRNLKRKRKASPPNFKKVRKYKSFTLKQYGWNLYEDTGTIRILNHVYKYFKSRNVEGKIKRITVKRDTLGDIYIYIVCDVKQEVITRTGKRVGYDFGYKKFLTASDGKDIISPMFFMRNSRILKSKSKNLSRKQDNSNNRKRARLDLARAHKRTANQRKDFHFKTA